ncbi:hypothetical protein [Synoicihabitans lomoniglobus]|uniref:Uncharacterized protein n=1 Tax=Synoicihabitans lomoniglobus TaxID=2909285 RepID=A0AAE9ZW57_9BACT|nr:hypothetical protein [Opitutaceae bacterium LMO-M01]WED64199.1 hypothetical protein PXH66_17825 [Opitutaceae bacterium LMO-M01]
MPLPRCYTFPRAPAFLLFALLIAHIGRADKHVAIRATASPDYEASRQTESGAPRVERYVFLKGKFFEGAIRDKSLEETEMIEVARALAPHLAKQNYLPTSETAEADIVIAVHWGLTTSLKHNTDYVMHMMEQAREQQRVDQDFYQAVYVDENGADIIPTDYAQSLLQQGAADRAAAPDYEWARMASTRSERDISERPIATVLGFSEALRRDAKRAVAGEDARTLRHYLNEERYFVILMAYDLKSGKDGKPMERKWVARLSVAAAGINFPMALERLGETGSDYFGTDQPELKVKRAPVNDHRGEVEIGDAIVIENP